MTYYTSSALDAKMGLPEFANKCFEAFSLKERCGPDVNSTAHEEKYLLEAEQELADWLMLSANIKQARVDTLNHESEISKQQCIQKAKAENDYFYGLMASVNKWEVPAQFDNIKTFMIEQITISINDLSVYGGWGEGITVEDHEARLVKSLNYAKENLTKMQGITDRRKKFERDFLDLLERTTE